MHVVKNKLRMKVFLSLLTAPDIENDYEVGENLNDLIDDAAYQLAAARGISPNLCKLQGLFCYRDNVRWEFEAYANGPKITIYELNLN